MPRAVNQESNNVKLYLKEGQKAKLQAIAESRGCNSISQLVSLIADGRLKLINDDAFMLLDFIRYWMLNVDRT